MRECHKDGRANCVWSYVVPLLSTNVRVHRGRADWQPVPKRVFESSPCSTPNMGVILWGAVSFGKPVPCTSLRFLRRGSHHARWIARKKTVRGHSPSHPEQLRGGDKPWGGSPLRRSVSQQRIVARNLFARTHHVTNRNLIRGRRLQARRGAIHWITVGC